MSFMFLILNILVMNDRNLAEIDGIEAGVLNQSVIRNSSRFLEESMFQFTKEELVEWKSQIGILNKEWAQEDV